MSNKSDAIDLGNVQALPVPGEDVIAYAVHVTSGECVVFECFTRSGYNHYPTKEQAAAVAKKYALKDQTVYKIIAVPVTE